MESISLEIVLFAALVIPLAMAKLRITSTPTAVAEIVVGIVLGQSLLGWVTPTATLTQLRQLGVIVLIFLSGMEIDFSLFKPTQKDGAIGPAKLAILGFTGVVAASAAFSWGLDRLGLFHHIGFATILFSTVALGVVIAALKEKELLSKPFGQTMLLLAALGEVVPLIALTVYASLNGSTTRSVWWLLLIFLAAIVLLLRFRRPYQFFAKIDKSTTQLDIRLAFFLIITLVTVAESVGAENILGAFLAGMVMKLLRPREETQDKLTSLGYGFFIPIFFIMTGANIDLKALLKDPQSLALIPVLLVGFLLAKILLWPILRLRFRQTNALAGTFLISTTITLVIPTLTVGRNLGIVTTQQSGAFTLAAIITCITCPILFNRFYQEEKADFKKTRLHIIGTNLLTVPIAQQLSRGLYDITMFTDDAEKFATYNSEANVKKLAGLAQSDLAQAQAFDCDILLLAYFDHDKNYQLAQTAIAAKVPRIIARFEAKNVENAQYDELAAAGVEVYNTFEANISMLRSLIESPSTLKILEDTTAGIFEITVRNRRFTGLEVKNLPFIDSMTISQIYRDHAFIAPHGDTQIHLGDHIIFSGDKAAIADIRRQLELAN
ncbi:monovalent cation:proton antiporter family protein [Lacticaseibacillus parakribbianus]|uniref:monovalent cation:proton antiporter family protein n=1 Tax=Lacticaseibacillus parakribbianus TaxID=2970927 RepID=UPI0021CB1374|nr:cation:proton antiporter [Lacticaseibacillus parakribbianus]